MVSADMPEASAAEALEVETEAGGELGWTTRDRVLRAALVLLPPLIVAAFVVVNAAPGLMPGVGFWDTGEFQTVLPLLGTAHPTGYPTYVLIGFLANILLTPFGEPAFRINLLSLLAVAFAAGATVALMRRLIDSTPIAMATGLGLSLTPVVWANATRADPHPIHLAFVALLLLVLVTWEQKRRAGTPDADRWLVAAAVVFGLSAGNHSLTLLLAPPIGLYVLATEPRIVLRPRLLGLCALAVIGSAAAVYLELPIRAGLIRAHLVYASPDTWDGFWYIALAEQFRGSLSDPLGDLPRKFGEIGRLAWNQFGFLTPLLPPAFLATIRMAPRYALLTGSAMVVTLLFNLSYANADIDRYYLGPVLWAWTWVGILAAFVFRLIVDWMPGAEARAGDGERTIGLRRAPVLSLANAVAVLVAIAILIPGINAMSLSRIQADRSNDTTAARWLAEAMPLFQPNAVVVSWWSTSTTLWYGQKIEGLRPDIFIVDDRTMLDMNLGGASDVIASYLGHQPVYLIRANGRDLALVTKDYELKQLLGNGSDALYEVVGRKVASG
jgi:transmembrane protein TMEM260 (protein O-mannosyltransferase)